MVGGPPGAVPRGPCEIAVGAHGWAGDFAEGTLPRGSAGRSVPRGAAPGRPPTIPALARPPCAPPRTCGTVRPRAGRIPSVERASHLTLHLRHHYEPSAQECGPGRYGGS